MKIEDYPLTLTPTHVAEILGVSMPTAYTFIRRHDFPRIKDKKVIFIPRQAFWVWYNTKAVGLSLEDFGESGIDSELRAPSLTLVT